MANWLITVNYSEFKLNQAYEVLSEIFWKNDVQDTNKGLQINDIVFVYVTQPISQIVYQFQVIAHAKNSEYPIEQRAFWVNQSDNNPYDGAYVILKPIARVDNKTTLSRGYLMAQGLIRKNDTLQGRRTDRGKVVDDPIKLLFDHIVQQFHLDNRAVDYPDEADTNNPRFYEGAKQSVVVNKYERSAAAREACIQKHGVNCQICAMNFEKTYGSFAKDFIHVHHIVPISQIDSNYQIDPEKDLIPVCPNCHAMLHKQVNGVDMTVETLRNFYHYSSQN